MKDNFSTNTATLAVTIAALTLTVTTSADQENEQGTETLELPATALEAAPPGVIGSGTLTIDGTGLRAESEQETDTIDGTGWEVLGSEGTDTIDGTGLRRSAPNADLADSGQTLHTVTPADSDDDCEVLAGANAATSGNCETEDSETN